MRNLLQIASLALLIFSACTIEEAEAVTYSTEYECGDETVTMFRLNGSQKISAGRNQWNFVEVTDSGVFVTVFFVDQSNQYRLNLNFYNDSTPSTCGPERKGDGTLLEVFPDGKYRFYSHDCFSGAQFILRNYDIDAQTACGHFFFTGTAPIGNHQITQGYFNFK